MRLGLVSYGNGGRHFHAPFLEAARGVEVAGVVARAEATRAAAREDLPGVPIHASLTEMLQTGVDAVTITTPPQTRRDLVLEAIAAGVHVVADKPFAPSAEVAREMQDAAREAGVVLSVFHNAPSTRTSAPSPGCSRAAGSGSCGASTPASTSTSPISSRQAPTAGCCVTSAPTWWTS